MYVGMDVVQADPLLECCGVSAVASGGDSITTAAALLILLPRS